MLKKGELCLSELCYLSMMRNQSLMLGTSIGHYGSDQCASVLSSIVKSSKGPLLSDTEKVILKYRGECIHLSSDRLFP